MGFFKDTVDFNLGPETTILTSNGANDIFIQKMDQLYTGFTNEKMTGKYLLIYPNPSQGKFTLEGDDIKEVIISNINGQVIRHIPVNGRNTNIDISDQPEGIYLLKAVSQNGTALRKIILE